MSDLLKNAIVDAEALKSVATKNAESLLLERFAGQIKEAVNQILEAPADEEDPLDAGGEEPPNTPGGMDPVGGGDMGMDDGMGGAVDAGAPSQIGANVQMAAQDGMNTCPCADEDEEIEIDFGDLQAQMAAPGDEGGELGSPMPAASLDTSVAGQASGDETEDEYSLKEEDILSLAEELEVDVEPVKSGWKDGSCAKTEDNTTMALAHAADDKAKEEREKLAKAVKELSESKKRLSQENKELKTLLEKSGKLLGAASLSNARLLYTNKALKDNSLNERQKISIAESLSKASSVANAKALYESLLSSMQAGGKTSPKSLNEAVSRVSANPLYAGRNRQASENPVNPQIERMQKLAGIRTKVSDTKKEK
jgi:hypothetical protein